MNELKIFNNTQFSQIRTVNMDGRIYFVGRDVAENLGYTNPMKAIRDHCKGVNETFIPTSGGRQKAKIIPEGDVFRLITHSKLPAAEKFESWVFDEVLVYNFPNTINDQKSMEKALLLISVKICGEVTKILTLSRVIDETEAI